MEKEKDYEMAIRRTTKTTAVCELCKCRSEEMYLFRRHGRSHYLCRKHIENLLLVACLSD